MGKPTEREIRLEQLHMKDGRKLSKHPAWVFVRGFLTRCLDNRESPFLSKGELTRRFDERTISLPPSLLLGTIMEIEEMNALLRQSNSEVDESLHCLHTAYNKVKSVSDVLIPELVKITQDIRTARMTTERELSETLTWLKTVREFFLERATKLK